MGRVGPVSPQLVAVFLQNLLDYTLLANTYSRGSYYLFVLSFDPSIALSQFSANTVIDSILVLRVKVMVLDLEEAQSEWEKSSGNATNLQLKGWHV